MEQKHQHPNPAEPYQNIKVPPPPHRLTIDSRYPKLAARCDSLAAGGGPSLISRSSSLSLFRVGTDKNEIKGRRVEFFKREEGLKEAKAQ